MELITSLDTFFKPSPADSKTIPEEAMAYVPAGSKFPIRAYRQEAGHLVFTIHPDDYDLTTLHSSGKNTWYAFEGAVRDPEGHSPDNRPIDVPPAAPGRDRGRPFKLPGFTQQFYSNDPITSKSPNFTWAEALHFAANGTYRPPANAQVVHRLLASAEAMQLVRDRLGKRIYVNSWYRDPAINGRVGGATQSRHIAGDGVDFRVEGMRPADVYAALNPWWGNRGGLASSSIFTHIDVRGHLARWSYGF
jgi:hypothetical protein